MRGNQIVRRILGMIFLALGWQGGSIADEIPPIPTKIREKIRDSSVSVLRTFISQEVKGPWNDCEIDSNWLVDPISADIARYYLKLNLYADLSPPFLELNVPDVFKDAHARESSYCSEAEATALWEKYVNNFKQSHELNDTSRRDTKILMRRLSLSRPVFKENFSVAIFKASFEQRVAVKIDEKDVPKRPSIYDSKGFGFLPPSGFAYTYVYKNEGASWKVVFSRQDAAFD